MQNKTPLYVLNKFMRFERKIYRIEDVRLPVAIHLKTVMYFFVSFIAFAIFVAFPGIGSIIRMFPNIVVLVILIAVPAFIAHVFAGAGTENRPPLNSLMAFIKYQIRKTKRESYYKGNIIKAPKPVRFINTSTVGFEQIRGKQSEPSDKLSSETHPQKSSVQS